MKIVLREWLHDKKACAMLISTLLSHCVYTVINARILIMISETLAHPEALRENLTILITACVINTLLGMMEAMVRPMARFHCFTSINNRYASKIVDADYELFTKFSVSKVYTIGEFMWETASLGVSWIKMVENIISMLVTLGSMYLIAGNLILPVIGVYVVGTIATKILYNVYDKIDAKIKDIKHIRNQIQENCIYGFSEVRTFNTGEYEKQRFRKYNKDIYALSVKRTRINMAIDGVLETVDTIGMVLVIIYSIKMVADGSMDSAVAMSLVMFVFRLISPLMAVIDFISELSQNLSLAKDFDSLMSYQNTSKLDGSVVLSSFNDSVTIEDVSFAYNDSNNVLHHLDMKIRKGEHIGICGRSGDGKSTLLKLLNRFYDVSDGSISIDGINIQDIEINSYRKKIGSVQQENVIFPGTIRENILYGTPHATEYELIEACKRAKIYDFIMSQDLRFDTTVGPRGIKLSGGQKQRIALARLFLVDPEIIILDEATSALDNDTEAFVQDAIASLQGKTIITVAHRLSTIKNCDQIYVMEAGRIKEHGNHDELMEAKGIYYSMLTNH